MIVHSTRSHNHVDDEDDDIDDNEYRSCAPLSADAAVITDLDAPIVCFPLKSYGIELITTETAPVPLQTILNPLQDSESFNTRTYLVST